MSSQQQSPGYKRRSSGKRSRRVTTATGPAAVTAVQDSVQAAETTENAPIGDKPIARTTSRNGSTGPGTKSRSSGKAETQAAAPPWRRIVNTDRFEGLQKFIREIWAEIKKVIWPDREATRNLTLVVIAVSIVLGILLGGIDYVLFQLFEALP